MTVGEWDQRQLCPDGGCVGVIKSDGTCSVCGRVAPNWGDERTRGLVPPEVAADADADDPDDDADDDGDDAGDDGLAMQHVDVDGDGEPAATADGDWPERELCSDGACIGVIGSDGRCKVCGKPGAEPVPPEPVLADAHAADAPANGPADVAAPPAPAAPEAAMKSLDPEPKS
ncbi:MAG TPA: hypothetical protein VFP84_28910 [Kofleriaceae bacterium]|nr:hypothetical protein [Kofleriaceae bacterium]